MCSVAAQRLTNGISKLDPAVLTNTNKIDVRCASIQKEIAYKTTHCIGFDAFSLCYLPDLLEEIEKGRLFYMIGEVGHLVGDSSSAEQASSVGAISLTVASLVS